MISQLKSRMKFINSSNREDEVLPDKNLKILSYITFETYISSRILHILILNK